MKVLGQLKEMFSLAWKEHKGYLWILMLFFISVTVLPFGEIFFPNLIIQKISVQSSFEGK